MCHSPDCRQKPLRVQCGIGQEELDEEGRVITAEYPDYRCMLCCCAAALAAPTCIAAPFCSKIKKQPPVASIKHHIECTTTRRHCYQQSSKARAAL